MGIITRMRKHKAVYWSVLNGGRANRHGQVEYAAPVEIECRWDDCHELFLDENGKEQVSNAIVYVDRSMSLQDLLRKGELTGDIDASPFKNTGVHAVRKYEEISNLRNTETLRTAML